MCTLMNIKTGGCSEDCSYCAQSSRYDTGLKASKMVDVQAVLDAAKIAKENGSTRFCMGAAWRDMRGRKTNLKNVKAMVEGVRALGMEACVTLGMIDAEQAKELKSAGLTAYNHNLDTSREHYPSVITTRTYDERLATIKNVSEAGIHVCTGGILGLGEKPQDHVGLIHTVATLPAHPESFPVNAYKGYTPWRKSSHQIRRSPPHHRHSTHRPAHYNHPACGRPEHDARGEADTVLPGRRQCHLHGREDVDDRVQWVGRGQGDV
jgi:biotin synthase